MESKSIARKVMAVKEASPSNPFDNSRVGYVVVDWLPESLIGKQVIVTVEDATFTLEDLENGQAPPKCLMDEVYQLMLEESVDPDYMCDREADYVMRVLEKGPWEVKL